MNLSVIRYALWGSLPFYVVIKQITHRSFGTRSGTEAHLRPVPITNDISMMPVGPSSTFARTSVCLLKTLVWTAWTRKWILELINYMSFCKSLLEFCGVDNRGGRGHRGAVCAPSPLRDSTMSHPSLGPQFGAGSGWWSYHSEGERMCRRICERSDVIFSARPISASFPRR